MASRAFSGVFSIPNRLIFHNKELGNVQIVREGRNLAELGFKKNRKFQIWEPNTKTRGKLGSPFWKIREPMRLARNSETPFCRRPLSILSNSSKDPSNTWGFWSGYPKKTTREIWDFFRTRAPDLLHA